MIYDAVIIGGGFYGASIATYLAEQRKLKRVLLLEKENKLFLKATRNNQARIHNGYHYPRSFRTAYRSHKNFFRFVGDWHEASISNFTKIYAIARQNSKVNSKQFERFCNEVGSNLKPLPAHFAGLFNTNLIEKAYEVEEYAFNVDVLEEMVLSNLKRAGVEIQTNSCVTECNLMERNTKILIVKTADDCISHIKTKILFNCTYSNLHSIKGSVVTTKAVLKNELTEMPLVSVPPRLTDVGITIMDGPFCSLMPYPTKNLHTLSHVRYTPHINWQSASDCPTNDPLRNYPLVSRFDRMRRDISRFVPEAGSIQYQGSIIETKTTLVKNELDDGRPILFEKNPHVEGVYSILGGKIDNIYDILSKLENEPIDDLL